MADTTQVSEKPSQNYVVSTLSKHFTGYEVADLVTVERRFPTSIAPDAEVAILNTLSELATNVVFYGMSQPDMYSVLSFSKVVSDARQPSVIGPVEYLDVDIGEGEKGTLSKSSDVVFSVRRGRWMFTV